MLLQDAIEHFIERKWRVSRHDGNEAEQCMQSLAHYLLHYSDLYQEQVDSDSETESEPNASEEWERQLEQKLMEMIDNDDTSDWSLGGLDSADFEPPHIREFIGWYLPRTDDDAQKLDQFCDILKDWFAEMTKDQVIDQTKHQDFVAVIVEMQPEAVRAMKVAQLLLHFVRWGSNTSQDIKDQPFVNFIEGHARLSRIEGEHVWWRFDDQKDDIGPIWVEQVMIDLLHIGDVLNVQLGQRGEQWQMLDIGPLYPSTVYVEAESYDVEEELGKSED